MSDIKNSYKISCRFFPHRNSKSISVQLRGLFEDYCNGTPVCHQLIQRDERLYPEEYFDFTSVVEHPVTFETELVPDYLYAGT